MSTESDPLNPKNSGDLKNSEDLKNPKNQEKSYNNIPPEIKKYSHHFLIFLVNLLILGLGIINLHYAQYSSLNPLLFCFIPLMFCLCYCTKYPILRTLLYSGIFIILILYFYFTF